MLSQSSVIFGAVAVAFFVYITRKGELPAYAGLLLLSPGTSQSTQQQASSSSSSIIAAAITAAGG